MRILYFLLAGSLIAADSGAVLVRGFEKDDAALVQLSRDGRLILTRGSRAIACRDGNGKCFAPVLAVWDAATGVLVGERSVDPGERPEVAHVASAWLTPDNAVVARLGIWRSGRLEYSQLLWDPAKGIASQTPTDEAAETSLCPISGTSRLTVSYPSRDFRHPAFERVDTDGVHSLRQPELSARAFPACGGWISNGRFLARSGKLGEALTWISTEPQAAPQPCRTFPGETIHGYTMSPDGSLVAVVTGQGEFPQHRVYLNALASNDCRLLRRMELSFPEKPGWTAPLLRPDLRSPNNVPFLDQLAARLAISPDNRMLAASYGIRREPNGLAFFGVYSMADGRRMATLAGDRYKCGIFHGALWSNKLVCGWAPLNGELQFSMDSRTLFATSRYLRQWDVSGLRGE